jgi:hypothetical protein
LEFLLERGLCPVPSARVFQLPKVQQVLGLGQLLWFTQHSGCDHESVSSAAVRRASGSKAAGFAAKGRKMIVYLSLLIALIGILMYALCINPKLSEIGRIMFWVGLLAFLFADQALVNVIHR